MFATCADTVLRNSDGTNGSGGASGCMLVDLIPVGLGGFKRRCVEEPFNCVNGKVIDPITGQKSETKHAVHGCKCTTEAIVAEGRLAGGDLWWLGKELDDDTPEVLLDYDPNCHTCSYSRGEGGEGRHCLKCKNGFYLYVENTISY